jgi:hypothetical protein
MAAIAISYPICQANQDDPGTDVVTRLAGAAISNGAPCYEDTNGKVGPADATNALKQQFIGISISENKVAGQSVAIVRHGLLAGYNLDSQAFGAIIYLDTAGALADAANGTKTVPIGKVTGTARTDSAGTILKLLRVGVNPLVIY